MPIFSFVVKNKLTDIVYIFVLYARKGSVGSVQQRLMISVQWAISASTFFFLYLTILDNNQPKPT